MPQVQRTILQPQQTMSVIDSIPRGFMKDTKLPVWGITAKELYIPVSDSESETGYRIVLLCGMNDKGDGEFPIIIDSTNHKTGAIREGFATVNFRNDCILQTQVKKNGEYIMENMSVSDVHKKFREFTLNFMKSQSTPVKHVDRGLTVDADLAISDANSHDFGFR